LRDFKDKYDVYTIISEQVKENTFSCPKAGN